MDDDEEDEDDEVNNTSASLWSVGLLSLFILISWLLLLF
jgi:hypothetical protein